MGHYMYVRFDAKLTKKGAEILKTFYDFINEHPSWTPERTKQAWSHTAHMFTEYLFVEVMLSNLLADFGTWAGTDRSKPGNVFSFEDRKWSVDCEFKWRGFDDAALRRQFMPYVVAEPVEVRIDHDLWDMPRYYTVQPEPLPKPDWYRKVGDP